MEPVTWGFIGTLLGAIVGASSSILTTKFNNQNAQKLQKQQEEFKRESSFRDFQRENYLKLQETLHKAFRLVSLMNIEDIKAFNETGKWQQNILNEENDNEFSTALRDIIFYKERISNDEIREDLKKIISKLSKANNSLNMSESSKILYELMVNDFDKLMSQIGTQIRLNY